MTNKDSLRHLRRYLKMLSAHQSARLFYRFSVLAVPALLTGCSAERISFLSPSGPVSSAQRGYFVDIILLLLIVVVPVLVLTPFFAWRYRYRNGEAPYRPNWALSWPLEILIWGVPTGIVVVLGVWLWGASHELDPYRPLAAKQPPLQVEVVGYDWKWLFIYPRLGIASVGQFALPADRPVSIKLTSDTVMQSFFIPALGSQIYAMAGMVTRLNLKANRVGSFLGENTQYNGKGFQRQKFTARAMAPDEFKAWVHHLQSNGIPLTAATYKTLSKRSTSEKVHNALHADQMPENTVYLRGVPNTLFANIVKSFHGGSAAAAELIGSADKMRSEAPSLAHAAAKAAKQD